MDLPDLGPHTDKWAHAVVGASIALVGEPLAARFLPDLSPNRRRLLVIATVAAAAIGKEVYDKQNYDRHTCDPLDAAATLVGGGGAMGVRFAIIDLRW